MVSIRLGLLCLLLVAFTQHGADAHRVPVVLDANNLWLSDLYGPADPTASLSTPPSEGSARDSTWADSVDYSVDGTGILSEMHRLFAIPYGERAPKEGPLSTKLLLALPLMGRDNQVQLICRPEQGIFTTYAKRVSLRRLNKSPKITAPSGMIAVDTHVHTCYSPDSMADISQVLLAAARRGLSGVAITDHNAFEGAERAVEIARRLIREKRLPETFFVIPGEEVSSQDGHIIALFLTHIVFSGMSAKQTIAAIHEQGGLAIAAHPLLECGVGALANSLPFDAVETHNGDEELHFARAKARARKRRADFYALVTKPRIGASDAHDPQALGVCYTLVEGAPGPQAVRQAILSGHTTAVIAFSDEQLKAITDHGLPRVVALDSVKDASFWLQRHLGGVHLSPFPRPTVQWATEF